MDFTGERVVPGKVQPDLLNEHVARYNFSCPLVSGAAVLDLGCGTGYGTALLSRYASRVSGLDLSPEAIHFARVHFSAPNADYVVGDAAALGYRTDCFDAVVCFEVIEHLWNQQSLLEEVKRVLKPGGVLIISTPNRVFYTLERQEANPYHTREFDFEEFLSFLKEYFPFVHVCYQNHVFSILIGGRELGSTANLTYGEPKEDPQRTSNFFVAVCSEEPLPLLSSLVYLPSEANLLREKERWIQELERKVACLDQKIVELQREYEERTRWSLELDRTLRQRDQQILGLNQELEDRSAWATRLSEEIAEKDGHILELQAEFEQRTDWALRLDSELKACEENLRTCQEAFRSCREKIDQIKASTLFRLARALRLVPGV
ncbi:MAG: methyltransferase domain-containing protein [Acidobacteriota bacterium]